MFCFVITTRLGQKWSRKYVLNDSDIVIRSEVLHDKIRQVSFSFIKTNIRIFIRVYPRFIFITN
jgi:hypothetical protein